MIVVGGSSDMSNARFAHTGHRTLYSSGSSITMLGSAMAALYVTRCGFLPIVLCLCSAIAFASFVLL
jgi:hypothetical protein